MLKYMNVQVDIVKKSNKWDCKVCRVKQMVQREFFRGSGAECRSKVQQLNSERGQKEQQHNDQKILEAEQQQNYEIRAHTLPSPGEKRRSKWAAFVDEPIKQSPQNNPGPKTTSFQDYDSDGSENISTKRPRVAYKRKAQSEYLVKEKPSSKWQQFL